MSDLKIYLDEQISEEINTLQELINIDNRICHNQINYNDFKNKCFLKNLNHLEGTYNLITDGEITNVYNALINYNLNIKSIHIARNNVAVNSWLVKRVKDYYNNMGINNDISLNIERNYTQYKNDESPIIIMGSLEFILGIKDIFTDKKIFYVEI